MFQQRIERIAHLRKCNQNTDEQGVAEDLVRQKRKERNNRDEDLAEDSGRFGVVEWRRMSATGDALTRTGERND